MELGDFKCRSCGRADWADGSDEDYAAATAEMRNVAPDASPPHRVVVCRGCGVRRIVLRTTFQIDASR